MNTATKLPVDRLSAMRITGLNHQKAARLADERVMKIEVTAKGVTILFQSIDKVRNRCVMLVRRDDVPGRSEWRFESQIEWSVGRPAESRTGIPMEAGGRYQEAIRYSHRRVTSPPPVRTRAISEVKLRWDEGPSSKMPLEPELICRALLRLSAGQHEWYYTRLKRDHGDVLAKPAWKAGYNLYIKEFTK